SSRRRHTRSYGDWSSDVCSSDLALPPRRYERHALQLPVTLLLQRGELIEGLTKDLGEGGVGAAIPEAVDPGERVILKMLDRGGRSERASCRERVKLEECGAARMI